jgi:hypothetical protein
MRKKNKFDTKLFAVAEMEREKESEQRLIISSRETTVIKLLT